VEVEAAEWGSGDDSSWAAQVAEGMSMGIMLVVVAEWRRRPR
jgi:hypothetical protein